jgi:hypothetical protein
MKKKHKSMPLPRIETAVVQPTTNKWDFRFSRRWGLAPWRLVEVYRRFRDTCCFHHQGYHHSDDGSFNHFLTSVSFYQTSRRNSQEDSHLHMSSKLYWLSYFTSTWKSCIRTEVTKDVWCPASWLTCPNFHLLRSGCPVAMHANHVSPASTRRDLHIQSATHTLARLSVTDNTLATASNYNKFYLLINTALESPSQYYHHRKIHSPLEHYNKIHLWTVKDSWGAYVPGLNLS